MGVNIGLADAEHPDKGYQLFITAIVMVVVAGLVVLGRLAARWANKGYGYDDYAIIVSLVFSVVLTATINLAIVHGYGRHKTSLKKSELSDALMYFYIAQVVYKIVIGFNKISILILYLRIFISRSFRLACYITLGIVSAFTVGSTVATIVQCIPIQASWDRSIKHATCTNKAAFWYAFAVINILTDAIILFLPVRQVLQLHLNRREKIGLLALFSLGAFVTVSSVIRATAVANSTRNQSDITWNFIPRGIWTLIEANTGIICASLPMLHKPATILFPCLRRGTTATTSSSRNPRSSYATRKGSSFRLGKSAPRTLPDGTTVPPVRGGGYQKQGSGSRREAWEKKEEEEDDDEHPLAGEPLPGRDLDEREEGRGRIVRRVDVDVTYQDNVGQAVTSDQRVQATTREAV